MTIMNLKTTWAEEGPLNQSYSLNSVKCFKVDKLNKPMSGILFKL